MTASTECPYKTENPSLRLTLDKHVVVSQLWNRSTLIELEVVKTASSLNSPLLLGLRCHFEDSFMQKV